MSRKVCVNEVDKTYPDLFYVRKIIFLYRLCSVASLPKHLQTRASQKFFGGGGASQILMLLARWATGIKA